jgi:sulfate permease, SulP family
VASVLATRSGSTPNIASTRLKRRLLARSSTPHVAFLGRIPGTEQYSDLARHPDNEPLIGVLACRPEASLLYLNTDYVQGRILDQLEVARPAKIKTVVCDLSASPLMDLAGAQMLAELSESLKDRGIELTISGAHGQVRDLLRAEGLDAKIHGIVRGRSLASELGARSDLTRGDDNQRTVGRP